MPFYYFLRVTSPPDAPNLEVDTPAGAACAWVAGDGEWRIYECRPEASFSEEEAQRVWETLRKDLVPRTLRWLLLSAEGYAPALALARDEVREVDSREELAEFLGRRLRFHLESQRTSGYFLARCVVDDGELVEGAWHWIVRWLPERNQVVYVSHDCFTYPESAASFDLDPALLARLR